MAKSTEPKTVRDLRLGLAWIPQYRNRDVFTSTRRGMRFNKEQRRQMRIAVAWLSEQLDGMDLQDMAKASTKQR